MNLVMNLVMNVECVYQRSMNDAWVNILIFDPESFCLEEECLALDKWGTEQMSPEGGEDNNLFVPTLNGTLQSVLFRKFKNISTTFEKL